MKLPASVIKRKQKQNAVTYNVQQREEYEVRGGEIRDK